MDSSDAHDAHEMREAFEKIQREFEDEMFERFRTVGTSMMDQYEAHVTFLRGLLREHRPYCPVFNRHHSEMCAGLGLSTAVEEMDINALRRSLVTALILLERGR